MESLPRALTAREPSNDTGEVLVTGEVTETSNGKDIMTVINPLEKMKLEDQPSGLVDTCAAVASLVESLSDLPKHPPSIYIDLEGVKLSRQGTVSILQLFVRPTNQTYLIDIHTLGAKAFLTPADNGHTLKAILESEAIPKAFFDVRNDSDALYSHFGIKLSGICDIQLMELATRSFSKRYLKGLAKCIEKDLSMTARERQTWMATKEGGKRLFAPELGGSYEVFNIRPMHEDVRNYCAQDVQYLPQLWQHYYSKLTSTWAIRVENATKDRVKLSQMASYNGQGRHRALGPWS